MKKSIYYLLVCMTMLCIAPNKARATHAAGAELLFQWVHDSTYQIFYKFYRDCSGVAQPTTVTICYYNSCNSQSGTLILDTLHGLIPPGVPNGSEVARECPGVHTTCSLATSTIPGYREWWYTGNVTLPSRCNHWTFNTYIQLRNPHITNLANPGGQNLYTEATLDNLDAQGDTSPFFSVKPVPYICANVPYVYNNGAYDINNDSMTFQLIQPENGSCGNVNNANDTCAWSVLSPPTYNLWNNPLLTNNTFSINSSTGLMSFTPSTTQIAVVTVRVDEYRSGIKIGSVMRDIQIIVLTCNVQQPAVDVQTASLNNCTFSNGEIVACAGAPFSFCYNATTPDTNGILVASDNSATIMPSSVVTYSNQGHDTVTGCFSWWPSVYDTGLKIFTVTVNDSTCRPPGIEFSQTFTLPIYIWPSTNILSDTGICIGGTATLLAVGGGNFTWTVLPGGAPLSTLSCTNCPNPTASPLVTTYYVVTSGITNPICKNKDTVTVKVADSVRLSIPDTATCVNNSLQLNLSVTTAATSYTVNWSPNTGLSDPTMADPVVTPPPGTPDFTYIITVSAGVALCNSYDTFHLHVLQGFHITNKDTTICLGKGVQVNGFGDPSYFYTWTPNNIAGVISNPNIITPVINPNGVGTTNFVATATYPGCKDSTNTFSITVEPVPNVIAGVDRQVCSGDTVHLAPIVSPAFSNYQYSWTPGNSIDNPLAANAVFFGTGTAHLTLTVQTAVAHCSGTDSVTIVVIKKSFLQFSPADTSICPYDTVQVHVFADPALDQIQNFYWTPNTYISNTNDANPLVWPASSARYTVYAKDTAGCLDTLSMYVNIKPGAVIDIPDSISIYPGDSYQINPGTNCSNFKWFPPTGLSADSISNPLASPTVNTKYLVTAKTEAGCMVQDSIKIYIAPDSYINIPNVFTPGGGPNNVLRVLHLGEATLKSFEIFNRWGVKVFESNDISKGWDGTFNGAPQPEGVYVYMVEAYTYKGVKLVKNGNVTLLR